MTSGVRGDHHSYAVTGLDVEVAHTRSAKRGLGSSRGTSAGLSRLGQAERSRRWSTFCNPFHDWDIENRYAKSNSVNKQTAERHYKAAREVAAAL